MSNNTKANLLIAVAVVCAVVVVMAIRLVWAHYVYHDTRCVVAECRIVK